MLRTLSIFCVLISLASTQLHCADARAHSEDWTAAATFLLEAHRSGHPNARFQLALLLLEGLYRDGALLFSGEHDVEDFEIMAAPDGEAVKRSSSSRTWNRTAS